MTDEEKEERAWVLAERLVEAVELIAAALLPEDEEEEGKTLG